MAAHVGVDVLSGVVHSLVGTAANVADVTQTHHLLHCDGQDVFADASYQSVGHRAEHQDRTVNSHVAMMRGKRKALREEDEGDQALEGRSASRRRRRCRWIIRCL